MMPMIISFKIMLWSALPYLQGSVGWSQLVGRFQKGILGYLAIFSCEAVRTILGQAKRTT